MSDEAMKCTYSDIEISYNEDKDRWDFELRGRRRSAESLAKAKEAIDKEPAEKRKQVFPRFTAYRFRYGQEIETVTVTSVADEQGFGGLRFWIAGKNGREKERCTMLFPVNESNDAIIIEMQSIQTQMDALEEKKDALREKLQSATIPKEIA